MAEISIIDYGLGNLRSVEKALEKVGAEVEVINDKNKILDSNALVIPGVGAFEDGIKNLEKYKKEIYKALNRNKPVLGICLGMQLSLTKGYEGENELNGLDIIRGEVISLPKKVKVPHIGWNNVEIQSNHPIFDGIKNNTYFYFVHSYYTNTKFQRDIIATCNYGIDFPAAISRKNYIGVQFHPEKSGKEGLKLLRNFVGLSEEKK